MTTKEKLMKQIEEVENKVKDAKAKIEELYNDLSRQDLQCTLFNHLCNNRYDYLINNIELLSFQDNSITLCINFEDDSYTLYKVCLTNEIKQL